MDDDALPRPDETTFDYAIRKLRFRMHKVRETQKLITRVSSKPPKTLSDDDERRTIYFLRTNQLLPADLRDKVLDFLQDLRSRKYRRKRGPKPLMLINRDLMITTTMHEISTTVALRQPEARRLPTKHRPSQRPPLLQER
jgi:hypothetical protein